MDYKFNGGSLLRILDDYLVIARDDFEAKFLSREISQPDLNLITDSLLNIIENSILVECYTKDGYYGFQSKDRRSNISISEKSMAFQSLNKPCDQNLKSIKIPGGKIRTLIYTWRDQFNVREWLKYFDNMVGYLS